MNEIITRPFQHRFFEGNFPDSHTCDGLEFAFKTDFRVWLRYDLILNEKKLSLKEKVNLITPLCFKKITGKPDVNKIAVAAVWFYNADHLDQSYLLENPALAAHRERYERRREEIENNIVNPAADFGYSPRAYSPFWDYRGIWGAFRAYFGIDLYKEELHWWGFAALLNELPVESAFSNLRRLRMKTKKDMPKEQWGDHRIDRILCSTPDRGVL